MRDLLFEDGGAVGLSAPKRGEAAERTRGGRVVVEGTTKAGEPFVTVFEKEDEDEKELAAVLSRELAAFATRIGAGELRSVLVAGLGNPRIDVDSLGSLAALRVTAGAAGRRKVGSVGIGVPEQTGIASAELVAAAAAVVDADLVIAVDSLAALAPERLCSVIQIAGGVIPGSGADGGSRGINSATVGRPVVTVGTPTAVKGRLSKGGSGADGLFTVCGIAGQVAFHAGVIASAIDSFLAE